MFFYSVGGKIKQIFGDFLEDFKPEYWYMFVLNNNTYNSKWYWVSIK